MKNIIDHLNEGGIIAVITFGVFLVVVIKMAVTILMHSKESRLDDNEIEKK